MVELLPDPARANPVGTRRKEKQSAEPNDRCQDMNRDGNRHNHLFATEPISSTFADLGA
jgi:hypothetical protein